MQDAWERWADGWRGTTPASEMQVSWIYRKNWRYYCESNKGGRPVAANNLIARTGWLFGPKQVAVDESGDENRRSFILARLPRSSGAASTIVALFPVFMPGASRQPFSSFLSVSIHTPSHSCLYKNRRQQIIDS
jgi:hypothetical protein